ncbi:hypothetical protein [Streptomyces sp. RKAG293]|uniref:hypothetical protein n=1 Tax=Streptomyces sp. RKAG293 TaxID=2893403 RepID=UPI0020335CB2|nr:hypothetical protein [Streptomyces sp. RKAG293]MCM2416527.1 hypothetical protein [Streptomyces sp. RKAG293]
MWSDTDTGGDGNGDRLANYVLGEHQYVSVEFIDCRRPDVKSYADKPTAQQGIFESCFDKPTGMLKGYPLLKPTDPQNPFRALPVGHLTVEVRPGAVDGTSINGSDIEAFLGSLDLASIAKL